MKRSACGVALVAIIGLAATAASVVAHDPIKSRVTWNGDVARIVQARCVSCHSATVRGTMSLATYEAARPWARSIKEEVMTRRMPKWHAVRGYGDFANDPSLSPFEIALVAAWADGGAPRGTDADVRSSTGAPAAAATAAEPPGARNITAPCGEYSPPAGQLLAVTPLLERGESVGISVRSPDGRREIVAWIKDFDPDAPTTYRLRTPIALSSGSVIVAEARGTCSITLLVTERR